MPRLRPNTSTIHGGTWIGPKRLCTHNARGQFVPDYARQLQRDQGVYAAARYLARRGWSIEAAFHYLNIR